MAFDANTLITAALSGGGALFVGAMVKAYRDLRSGARARDRDTVGSLREQRNEAEARTRDLVGDGFFYVDVIGRLVRQVRELGVEPDLPAGGLVPPSQRDPDPAPPTSPRRGWRPAA